jgi:hypothetical protein
LAKQYPLSSCILPRMGAEYNLFRDAKLFFVGPRRREPTAFLCQTGHSDYSNPASARLRRVSFTKAATQALTLRQ